MWVELDVGEWWPALHHSRLDPQDRISRVPFDQELDGLPDTMEN